jgi:Mrp family chromosome partitioning ATPase
MLRDTFWGRLDVLLFDTPPGTSDEHLTIIKLLRGATKPEGVIVVTTPQEVARGVVRREITFCKQMNLNILGLVENMSGYLCPCCNEISGK